MATSAPFMALGDVIERRVMVAIELIDPVTGGLASHGLTVSVPGQSRPVRTPAGRFVLNDFDPPADRDLVIRVTSLDGRFADEAVTRRVLAHTPATSASALVKQIMLRPTGLYRVPAGIAAVSGMLIDGAATRAPIAEAKVQLHYRDALASAVVAGRYVGLTDARGGFVAALPDLADAAAMPLMAGRGAPVCWLRVDHGGATRFTPLLPIRVGRSVPLPDPLVWDQLLNASPPAP